MARRAYDIPTPDLLAAARRRFLQWGYSGTSMSSLASDLGITKAALYYYYPDKETLFLAVVSDYLSGVATELERLPPLFDQNDQMAAFGALADVFLGRHTTSGQIQHLSMQESRHLTEKGRNTLSGTYHGLMVRPVATLLNRAAERGWIRDTLPDEPPAIWVFLGLLSAFLQPEPAHATDQITGHSPSREAFLRLFLNSLSGESSCRLPS